MARGGSPRRPRTVFLRPSISSWSQRNLSSSSSVITSTMASNSASSGVVLLRCCCSSRCRFSSMIVMSNFAREAMSEVEIDASWGFVASWSSRASSTFWIFVSVSSGLAAESGLRLASSEEFFPDGTHRPPGSRSLLAIDDLPLFARLIAADFAGGLQQTDGGDHSDAAPPQQTPKSTRAEWAAIVEGRDDLLIDGLLVTNAEASELVQQSF